MAKNKFQLAALSALAAMTLAACGGTDEPQMQQETEVEVPEDSGSESAHGDHSTMDHSGSGEVPEGLEEAADPAYPVGSEAVIEADHMEGMQGAEATIAGAYDTVVYSVTYTPEGGEPVEDHKWVIHEELQDPGDAPLKAGDEAIIDASHMDGMEGATATIDTAEETTVYMVDFNTPGGMEVTNHKWVTESELTAK